MTAREGESALSRKKFVDCDGKWRILLQSVALWTAQHTFADSTMFFTSISGLKDFVSTLIVSWAALKSFLLWEPE